MLKKYFLILLFIYEYLQQSEVYYTKNISSQAIVEMFKKLNITLPGRVGIKVHTGEILGPYYLRPDFLQPIYDYLNGTFIECNTAYTSYGRHTTELHEYTLRRNGWLDNDRRTIIMDEDPNKDFNLSIPNHRNISNNIVGEHLKDFDSCLVVAHFKGHAMGGFGGALKQLSIGFASRAGKSNIHSGGYTCNYMETWDHKAEQKDFTTAMADAASSIVSYFRDKGQIAFINVMANISIRCDCGVLAPPPKIKDLGIMASLDPVAIDRASIDLIAKQNNMGSEEWLDNMNSLLGLNTIKVAEDLGVGSQNYTLINVDPDDPDDEKDDKVEDNGNLKLFLLILIPCVVILLLAAGLIIFFFYKKRTQNQTTDGSLGVSMTDKNQ